MVHSNLGVCKMILIMMLTVRFYNFFFKWIKFYGQIIISQNDKLVKSMQKYKSITNNNYYEKGCIVSFDIKECENKFQN